ncbi:MAG: GntR family transcriptional regulator [Chitinivibrionales bacterium]|nr:GntR family transcriptional regulator [Chitinivibrionales bacterium]
MKKPSRRPAVEKAIAFIQDYLSRSRPDREYSLPGVRALAQMAGVSHVTAWKALDRVRKDRGIAGGNGLKFTFAKHRNETAPSDEILLQSQPADVRVAAAIKRDIINGVYAPGAEMPSYKELGARYGASFLTLRKACMRLAKQNILRLYNRRYAVVDAGSTFSYGKIVFLGYCDAKGNIYRGVLSEELLRTLEAECTKAGLHLLIFGYREIDNRLVYFDSRSGKQTPLPGDESIIGYLCVNLPNPSGNAIDTLCRQLCLKKKHVAVYNETPGWVPTTTIAARSRNRFFTVSISTNAGGQVGRFLQMRGQKKPAYITTFKSTLWSQKRYQDLCGTYTETSPSICIPLYSNDAPDGKKLLKHRAGPVFDNDVLAKSVGRLENYFSSSIDPLIHTYASGLLRRVLYSTQLYISLKPRLEEALSDRSITAWVCANDFAAVIARYFLQEKGVDVPRRLWIVGFNDSFDAMINGLTSYNFNIPACAAALLGFLVRRPPFSLEGGKTIQIDGMVIERQSTSSIHSPQI